MSKDFEDQMEGRIERALTGAIIKKVEEGIWEAAMKNNQGEKLLLPNLSIKKLVAVGFVLEVVMCIAVIMLDLFTDEEIDPYLHYGMFAAVLLTGSIMVYLMRAKVIVSEASVRVHSVFRVQRIDFSEIQKVSVKSFPPRFILHSPNRHNKVSVPASYIGTGEFVTILYNKLGYEKSIPAIVHRDMNKERYKNRYRNTF